MSKPSISMIVAVAKNNVIGANNDMPWRLSTDLKRFKAVTHGKPIIMGRKTYESIGRPLPGRQNIVISRNQDLKIDGVDTVASLDTAIELASANAPNEIMITGGGQIYADAMALADRLYVTHVDAEPEGDTYFPDISEDIWQVDHEEVIPKGEKDTADTTYKIYTRVKSR